MENERHGAPQGSAPDGDKAERRQLTVMFCDLVGSTALSGIMDPEDLRDVTRAYQDTCAGVIKRYGGFIARFMGDGVLVYFGYPQAHEDDAERAVRAGLEIVTAVSALSLRPGPSQGVQALSVRVGIATGRVVVGDLIGEGASEEAAVVGETPNLAARLQGLAKPNQVVIAPATQRLTGGHFDYENLGAQTLKGISGPVQAWAVTASRIAESRFEAAHSAALTPLTGRDEEREILDRRWKRTTEGEGQVALLSGEAGIGKSRLTLAMHETAGRAAHARLNFQCSPHHSNSALYPFIIQLERDAGFASGDSPETKLDKMETWISRFPDYGDDDAAVLAELLSLPGGNRYPSPDMSPQQIKERILSILAGQISGLAANTPLLLIFEDAHWIDATSSELLNIVVERVTSLPIMILITFRPEFDPPWVGQSQVTLLSLSRMNRRQSEEMVSKVTRGKTLPAEVLDQIVGKTDGVPLFVEELTKTVLESGLMKERDDAYVLDGPLPPLAIPETLQDSLMARLDQLAPVKEIAQMGAVIGREFSYPLLAAVASYAENDLRQALDRLVQSELVFRRGVGDGAVYVFKHALVQDTAYAGLLKSQRQLLHARIAGAINDLFPDLAESEPETLAHHFTEAGMIKEAVEYWRRAGKHAADRSAHVEAIGNFAKGFAVTRNMDDSPERAELELEFLLAQAGSMRIIDQHEKALVVLGRAEAIAAGHGLTATLSKIHHMRGNIYFPMGRMDECREQHQRALHFARESLSAEAEAQALGGLGDAEYIRGRMISSNNYFKECIDLCRRHGFRDIEGANLYMVGWSGYYQLITTEVLKIGLEAAAITEGLGNVRGQSIAIGLAAYIACDMGDFDNASTLTEQAIALTRKIGSRTF
ncbi:MAG: AAA family ATPase, partial [Rhodospirillales bacterium]|nr:AAA family ATPase [Rhodospirillales bacterium]